MRARLALVVTVLSCLAAAWVGCSVYGQDLLVAGSDASVDGPSASDVSGGDASADGMGTADVSAADVLEAAPGSDSGGDGGTCVLVHPPPPPAQDDPSDAGDIEIVLAVRTFDLGIRPDGGAPPLVGYDIDGLCTCPGLAD